MPDHFRKWKNETNASFKKYYAVTLDDLGLDEEYLLKHHNDNETSQEFVDWFASKYNLTSLAEVMIRKNVHS